MFLARSCMVEVADIEQIAESVKRFTLVPVDAGTVLPFHPGAHVETCIGTRNVVLRRHYSLCSDADETRFYQIAVSKSKTSRGGSRYWHEQVIVGQRLEVSVPVNHLSLSRTARHHLFVAGGIGITPFISMMLALRRQGQSFELHMAAKSALACPFYDWLSGTFPGQVHFYFSTEGCRLTPNLLQDQLLGTHLYVCGPPGMMKEFRDCARAIGYPKQSVHMEAFTASQGGDNHPFRAFLEKQGRWVDVPGHQTLLAALREADVNVPSSCEVGGCGTCMVGVIDGDVDHRDFYLTGEEQAQGREILCCVSRAKKDRLVLDL
ncbi:PDR/VanB family oxidoreductase [Alicyclobacillus ferrooxydans]|nr:PDR/VanB family oxidoreductase [Alicyclobacillus ferrooxydans]